MSRNITYQCIISSQEKNIFPATFKSKKLKNHQAYNVFSHTILEDGQFTSTVVPRMLERSQTFHPDAISNGMFVRSTSGANTKLKSKAVKLWRMFLKNCDFPA